MLPTPTRRVALLALALLAGCLQPGKGQDPGSDVVPPTPPTGVTANAASATEVSVSWGASTDSGTGVAGYFVYRGAVQAGTVFAPTLTFQDTGLDAATSYAYTVRAFDRATPPNVSEASSSADVTTPALPDLVPPTVPQDVTAVSPLATRAIVTWSASTDEGAGLAGYQIFRGATLAATVGPAVLTWQDDGLSAATAYVYTVRAFDAAQPPNVSAASGAANVTTLAVDAVPPTIPQGVVATALAFDRVRVTWSASTDAITGVGGYQVRRGGVLVGTVAAPTTLFEEQGLTELTTYGYSVRAFDRNEPPNVSGDSSTASALTPSRPPGLDRRPTNLSCIAPARPNENASVFRDDPWPNLPPFAQPVKALQPPGDPSRWFVVEQSGRVRSFANVPTVSSASVVLDLAANPDRHFHWGGEMGLLGLALHPSWPTPAEAFVLYTTQIDGTPVARQTRISRFTSGDGGATLNPDSEQVLLAVRQVDPGHKAGDLHFGPDGYLYASLGDGGGVYDQFGNSQKLGTVLAKIIRIDVQGTGATYAIPPGNPYAEFPPGTPNTKCPPEGRAEPCPEMWAFGFRNPWRWSFDRLTGDLWVGDVGQDNWEEVSFIPAGPPPPTTKGYNYGWNVREGSHCTFGGTCAQPGTFLNGGLVVDPVVEYPHEIGPITTGDFSVTGGYVYRGTAIPALAGLYLFGDFGSGNVWTHEPGVSGSRTLLFNAGVPISSFAQDALGELYVTDYGGGKLYRIEPVPGGGAGQDTVPMDLAQACPSAADPDGPDSVLIPYALNAPFWSDGAQKDRWMALPEGATVTIEPGSLDWTFPIGTVLVKQFRLGGKRIETRLLMRHTDGSWGGYTYEWNDTETAATRVKGGKLKPVGAQTWLYPSDSQCLQCHTGAAGRTLGPETAQQNGPITYPATGRTANQLVSLEAIGVLTLPSPANTLPAYPNPFGAAPLEQRARAYLHSNCSNCHRPGGPTPVQLDFRYSTPLAQVGVCNVTPSAGDLGITGAKLVAPGSPATSIVLERVKRTDLNRMPPLGRFIQDPQGVQLLTDWIAQLPGCP